MEEVSEEVDELEGKSKIMGGGMISQSTDEEVKEERVEEDWEGK